MLFTKKIFYISFIIFILSCGTFYVFYKTTDLVNNALQHYLNTVTEKDAVLQFKNMQGFFLNEVEFEDVKITLKAGQVIKTNYLRARFNLLKLIFGEYDLSRIYIDSLYLDIDPNLADSTLVTTETEDKIYYFNIYNELNYNVFNIPKISIQHGTVILDKKDKTMIKSLSYEGSFIVAEKIDIDCRAVSGIYSFGGIDRNFAMRVHIIGDNIGIQFNHVRIVLEETKLFGKGKLNFDHDNNFLILLDESQLYSKDLSFINIFSEIESKFSFSVEANGNKSGANIKLHVDSATVAELNFNNSDFETFFNFSKENLNIFSSNINMNGGNYKIKGTILSEENNINVNFHNLDLSKIGVTKFKTDLNGFAKLFQSKIDFSEFSFENNRINLTNSKVDQYSITSAELIFVNDLHHYEIIENSFLSIGKAAKFKINGKINSDSLKLHLNSKNASIDRIMNDIGAKMIKGRVESSIELFGILDDPNAKVSIKSDSIEFFKGFKTFNAEIGFIGSNIFSDIRASGYIRSDSAQIGKISSFHLNIDFSVDEDSIAFQKIALFDGLNGVRFDGMIVYKDSTVDFIFDHFDSRYNEYTVRNEKALRIIKNKNVYTISPTSFITPQGGKFSFGGLYLTNGEAELKGSLKNIQFKPFNQFLNYKHSIFGEVNGNFQIHNLNDFFYDVKIDVDNISFTTKLDSGLFRRIGKDTVSFGKASLEYIFSNGNYQINHLQFDDGVSRFKMSGKFKNQIDTVNMSQYFNIDANFSQIDLSKYNLFLEYYKRISGFVDGSVRLEGDRYNPLGEIELNSEHLTVNDLDFQGFLKSRIAEGKWIIDKSRIKVNETNLDIVGWKKLKLDEKSLSDIFVKDKFYYNVKAKADTISAISSLNDEITQIIGKIDLNLTFDGTFKNPRLEKGIISFKNTSFILDKLGNPLEDINYFGKIENGILRVENFSAKTTYSYGALSSTKSGYLYMNGRVNLSNLLHPTVNLSLQLDDFFIDYYIENAEVLASSENLKITGRDTILIKGDLTISDSKIYFDYENGIKTRFQSNKELKDKFTKIDVNIILADNVRIYNVDPTGLKGFDFTLETAIGSSINFIQNPDESRQMRGQIYIVDGSFTSFKTFEVEEGMINLNDQNLKGLSFNPLVVFKGIYESSSYIFKVDFNDYLIDLSSVKIAVYDINDENRNLNKTDDQVALLLLFGQEDINNIDKSVAIQTIATSLVSSNWNLITGIEVKGIGGEIRDTQNSNNEFSFRIKTRSIQLAKGLKIKAVLNSANKSKIIETYEVSYRLSDNIKIYFSQFQNDDLTQNNADSEYNVWLKWYHEF